MSFPNIQTYLDTGELTEEAFTEIKSLANKYLKNSIYHMLLRLSKDELIHDMAINAIEGIERYKYDSTKSRITGFIRMRFRNYIINRMRLFKTKRYNVMVAPPLPSEDCEEEIDIFDNPSFKKYEQNNTSDNVKDYREYYVNYLLKNLQNHLRDGSQEHQVCKIILNAIKDGYIGFYNAAQVQMDLNIENYYVARDVIFFLKKINKVIHKKYIKDIKDGKIYV
jgi:hypothetical protein